MHRDQTHQKHPACGCDQKLRDTSNGNATQLQHNRQAKRQIRQGKSNSSIVRAQIIDLIRHTGTTSNVGRDRRSGQPHFRKRPPAINQRRIQYDINTVGDDQRPHGNAGITGTSKNRIVQKQKYNGETAAKHDAGIGLPGVDHCLPGAHQQQNSVCIKKTHHPDQY